MIEVLKLHTDVSHETQTTSNVQMYIIEIKNSTNVLILI